MLQKLDKKNFELYQIFMHKLFVPKFSSTSISYTSDALKEMLNKSWFHISFLIF